MSQICTLYYGCWVIQHNLQNLLHPGAPHYRHSKTEDKFPNAHIPPPTSCVGVWPTITNLAKFHLAACHITPIVTSHTEYRSACQSPSPNYWYVCHQIIMLSSLSIMSLVCKYLNEVFTAKVYIIIQRESRSQGQLLNILCTKEFCSWYLDDSSFY